jgi:adenine-specific DNA-methyltransferase
MMKNRLEIAKLLLSDNSFIVIQCDKNEDSYLKVLCDEIFGRNNFINAIACLSSTPSGVKTTSRYKTIIKTKDTLLVYKKGDPIIVPQYIKTAEFDTHFNMYFDETNNKIFPLKEIIIKEKIYKSDIPISD